MYKIKNIVDEEPDELERRMNTFIKAYNEEIFIKDIKFSTHFDTYNNVDEYCAMIIYERKGE